MSIDPKKIALLSTLPGRPAASGELRREDQVFFVSADLPVRPTLETVFESDCQKPVDLFRFSFDCSAHFQDAEELVRQFKKNFRGYLLGRFNQAPSPIVTDRAYAAGLDMIEIPLQQQTLAEISEEQWRALYYARSVFPAWSVTASLSLTSDPKIAEALLDRGILPLLLLESTFSHIPQERLTERFAHLARAWKKKKVTLKPLLALLELTTPLSTPPRRSGLSGLLDRVEDARLRTVSDLRRQLRVREVEASFESAGL